MTADSIFEITVCDWSGIHTITFSRVGNGGPFAGGILVGICKAGEPDGQEKVVEISREDGRDLMRALQVEFKND